VFHKLSIDLLLNVHPYKIVEMFISFTTTIQMTTLFTTQQHLISTYLKEIE